jgi:HlyD family secretion protein
MKFDLKRLVIRKKLIIAILFILAVVGSTFYIKDMQSTASPTKAPTPSPKTAPSTVSALGRLEPQWKVIKLSAATSSTFDLGRISKLLVKEGDIVEANQIVAILDSHDRQRAAVAEAERQVDIAKARLAQTEAGAKRGDISAQESAIARLEAELKNAQLEFKRAQDLYTSGVISASELDARRLSVETTTKELNRSRATLNSISEVRPVDIELAKAEVGSAIAAVQRAKANLESTYVRALTSGQVLKIHARPGETIGDKGVMEIGATSQMYVVAEVFESDIGRVKAGQRATISANSIKQELTGTVEEIGLLIGKRDILDTDPVADIDARVVEVRIRLNSEDSKRVSNLTNMRVEVKIDEEQSKSL